MAEGARDIETEVIDLTGLSPSEIDALEPSRLTRTLAWFIDREEDPTDPLFGGPPPPRRRSPPAEDSE